MHKCQHTRRSCKDTRHCEGYTRRRWKCATCGVLFSTIEVQVDLRKGQSAMDALKEQLGTQVNIKELNTAIKLLGRIRKGTA